VPVNSFDGAELPNVLTANKDNINDFLDLNEIFHTCMRYSLIILDRWGNLLFEQSESSEPFSGKTKGGEELNTGVYFYKLTYESGEKTGFIHLLK
jgi:gliding motility-associated-like protein